MHVAFRATARAARPSPSSSSSSSSARGLASSASRRRRAPLVAVAAAASEPAAAVDPAALKADLISAKKDLAALISSKHCNPILLRIAFHDAGTYKKDAPPASRGGAVGASHFAENINHPHNAGLPVAVSLLEPIKAKHPLVSWADLFQLSSAVAIELAGGPALPLKYGRVDSAAPEDADPGNLPEATPVDGPSGHGKFYDGSATAADHLRRIFTGHMGLGDREIVALSGAHCLGRVRPERSGFGKESTKYTENGPGTPGGQSWSVDWLKFDNDYFVEALKKKEGKGDPDLISMPTDAAVFSDDAFAAIGKAYAEDQDLFFRDYVDAHVKMSELGVTWAPGTPVTL
jgi:L-ascorbate peroxidase